MLGDFKLMGDFDIQVDFNIDPAAWPASGVGAGIVSQLFDVRRVAANGPQGVDTYSFGIPGKGISNVNTGDMSGKLRLKRKGYIV